MIGGAGGNYTFSFNEHPPPPDNTVRTLLLSGRLNLSILSHFEFFGHFFNIKLFASWFGKVYMILSLVLDCEGQAFVLAYD